MARTSVRKAKLDSGNGRDGADGGKRGDWHELVEVGPGTPMGNFLRTFWHPVAVARELADGSATPIRIMGEDLTLYRGTSGRPYIVAHRCPHRSTVLHVGWIEDDTIRCRYHGWRFDGTGQCVEMPAEDASFPPKVKILNYPARDYAGLVFAYMGDGEPPLFPRKAELERDYGVAWSSMQIWPCSWFQRIENSMDAVHVSFVHQETKFGEALSYKVPTLAYKETEWGLKQIATRSADNVRVSEFSIPNCNHIVVPTRPAGHTGEEPLPWTNIFNWFVPVDDTHTAFFTARQAPISGPDAAEFESLIAAADSYNPADHEETLFQGNLPGDGIGETATGLVNAQDYIAQVGQGTIVDRSQEWLGRSDEGVIALRGIFRRELEAIKRGKPLKTWKPRHGFARMPVPPDVPPSPDPEPVGAGA